MTLRRILTAATGAVFRSKTIVPAHGQDYNATAAREALRLNPVRGKKVLVIGCNTGRDCSYFIQAKAAEVHGVDVTDKIGTDFPHPRVHYHRTSAEAMSCLADSQFDLTFSFAAMEHIQDIAAAFQEMYRVTKPGGLLYSVAGPLWHSRYGHHKGNLFQNFPWIHLCLPRDEIVAWFEEHYPDIMPQETGDIRQHVESMLNPQFLNRRPAREYLAACAALPMRPPRLMVNELVLDDASHLTPDLREILGDRYDDTELLASGHRFIATK